MRFLIVLALMKCAAAYSVIDPSNHKTVSVPIGNGMNVDIDVTVDVNTGAGDVDCVAAGWKEPCKSDSDCCYLYGFDIACRDTSYGKRCVTDEKCYAKKESCYPKLFNCCPGMSCQSGGEIEEGKCWDVNEQCQPEGGDCALYPLDCCEPLWCVKNPSAGTSTCERRKDTGPKPCITKGPCDPRNPGLARCCKGYFCKKGYFYSKCQKKTETDDGCTLAGDTCETSSECCEYPGTTMTCKESGLGDKRCMNAKDQKCHANEGEGCAYDDDCCEEDNICAGEWGYRREAFTQKCQLKPEQCSANEGEECLSDHDCCEKDHVCHVIMKERRSYCGLKDDYPKPNDCIADGEPCHGTDDWVHECCSESCCEGKCGTCGTPWYKRS